MKQTMSLLRRCQYDEMAKLTVAGRVLDLGGDRRSGYHELLGGSHKIEVVNLNEACQPDFRFNIEESFPLAAETYDAVICLNVLEHIFNFQNVLNESARVLKPGGRFIGATPFLFNIHGSPDDYFRYTGSALRRAFASAGFREARVAELGYGLFSVGYQLTFGLYRFNSIRSLAMRTAVGLDKALLHKLLKLARPGHRLTQMFLPLGYFFEAQK